MRQLVRLKVNDYFINQDYSLAATYLCLSNEASSFVAEKLNTLHSITLKLATFNGLVKDYLIVLSDDEAYSQVTLFLVSPWHGLKNNTTPRVFVNNTVEERLAELFKTNGLPSPWVWQIDGGRDKKPQVIKRNNNDWQLLQQELSAYNLLLTWDCTNFKLIVQPFAKIMPIILVIDKVESRVLEATPNISQLITYQEHNSYYQALSNIYQLVPNSFITIAGISYRLLGWAGEITINEQQVEFVHTNLTLSLPDANYVRPMVRGYITSLLPATISGGLDAKGRYAITLAASNNPIVAINKIECFANEDSGMHFPLNHGVKIASGGDSEPFYSQPLIYGAYNNLEESNIVNSHNVSEYKIMTSCSLSLAINDNKSEESIAFNNDSSSIVLTNQENIASISMASDNYVAEAIDLVHQSNDSYISSESYQLSAENAALTATELHMGSALLEVTADHIAFESAEQNIIAQQYFVQAETMHLLGDKLNLESKEVKLNGKQLTLSAEAITICAGNTSFSIKNEICNLQTKKLIISAAQCPLALQEESND